jgi:hypothetical protein
VKANETKKPFGRSSRIIMASKAARAGPRVAPIADKATLHPHIPNERSHLVSLIRSGRTNECPLGAEKSFQMSELKRVGRSLR